MIYLLLFLFFFKHFLADYLWQTPRMSADKGTYGALGGLQHAGLHGAFTYVILLHFVDPVFALGLAVFDAFLHYHIDWAKRQFSQGLTTEDRAFWIWFGIDQFLHAATYFIVVFLTGLLIFNGAIIS
jgi:hypothetical protein